MTNRDELVKEFVEYCNNHKLSKGKPVAVEELTEDDLEPINAVIDFCIARERTQIARVVEPLRDVIRFNNNCGDNVDRWEMVNEFEARVEQSLAIAEEILKG